MSERAERWHVEARAEREVVRRRHLRRHAIADADTFAERTGRTYWVRDGSNGRVVHVASRLSPTTPEETPDEQ